LRKLILLLLWVPLASYAQVSGTINRHVKKTPPIIIYRTEIDPVPVVVRATAAKPKRPPPTLPPQVFAPTLTPKEDQPTVTFDTRPPSVLIAEARANLTNREGPYDIAINNLRSVILTEKPDVAKEAYELLGYAYEKSKDFEKAKIQYKKYITLYPTKDDDWTRVQQRLMSLEIMEPTEQFAGSGVHDKPRTGDSKEFEGTVSEYGYFGNSIQSLFGLQTTYKDTHNQYVQTYRFRFSSLDDVRDPSRGKRKLSQAYWDFQDTFEKYGIRIGRQPTVAGSLSHFDGISGKYKYDTEWTFGAGAGYLYNPSSDTSRLFQGISADWRINQEYSAGFYYNRQTADSFLERSALGTELQYSSHDTTGIFRFEYDLVYNKINLFSFQGMTYFGDASAFLVIDKRRSPILFADVALGVGGLNPSKQVYNSVGELLNRSGLSSSDIYNYITNTTQIANSYVIGASYNLPKWTLTSDFQVTNLSTAPGFTLSPQFDPVPIKIGMKNNYSLNFHAKGEDFLRAGNDFEFVVNRTTGGIDSYFITVSDVYRMGKNNIALTLRDDYVNRHTLSGILRVIYAISERGTIEAQYARVVVLGEGNDSQTFYIGYRYDF
jgi:tetratricopeptide (TPR) repeat protein